MAVIKLRPLADRIVVIPDEAESISKGGIIMSDAHKDKPLHGNVIAVGPGKYSEKGDLIPMLTKKGDKVYYPHFAGMHIELDRKEYLIIHESDVIAVQEETKK